MPATEHFQPLIASSKMQSGCDFYFFFFCCVQCVLDSIPHQQFGSLSMKIKWIPKPVLKLRELNSCQSCIHGYKLAKAQVEGWSPSGQRSRGNCMFPLHWGFGISLPSEFTASHKAPEQNPDLELFKSPDLLSVASSPTAFICCDIVKASSCETWLAVCASRYRAPQGHQPKLKVCQCSWCLLVW